MNIFPAAQKRFFFASPIRKSDYINSFLIYFFFQKKNQKVHKKKVIPPIQEASLWRYYPRKIKNWIEDARTTQGFYDETGKWYQTKVPNEKPPPQLSEQAEIASAEALLAPDNVEEDLKTNYRFGIQPEEVKNIHPRLRNFLLLANGSPNEQKQFKIQKAIENYRRDITDTGSSEVQGFFFSFFFFIQKSLLHFFKNI